MSRDFVKTTTDYMTLPSGDASTLSGSTITAFSLWANIDTLNGGSTSNYLFACPNPTSASNAFIANITGTGLLQIRGRASASESTRTVQHSIAASTGVWNQFGGQIDWANDLIYTVLNGVQESHSTTGWTATTFTAGVGTGQFRIGNLSGTPTAAAASDGRLAHPAFWTNALLTASDWQALGNGTSPLKVRRDNLVLYRTLDAIDAVETDLVSHGQVTITGTLSPGANEAPVEMFSDAFMEADAGWMEPSLLTIAPQAWGNIMRQMAS